MTLTRYDAPLAPGAPSTVNYRIEGPAHRLFAHGFTRRIRARFAGRLVLESTAGMLLHETGLLPQLYVPESDLNQDLLRPSEHTTHCPFKGDASYRDVVVGDRVAEHAVWSYQEPTADVGWLAGWAAVYWHAMDAWFDEDEQVEGHIRDPYHRVDCVPSSRQVEIRYHGTPIASSSDVLVVSETGFPDRYYLPREALVQQQAELLDSETRTVCPYKGRASYYALRCGTGPEAEILDDAVFSYEAPLPPAAALRGRLCLLHEELTIRA